MGFVPYEGSVAIHYSVSEHSITPAKLDRIADKGRNVPVVIVSFLSPLTEAERLTKIKPTEGARRN